MMGHQHCKIFPDGLQVHCSIGTVEVESNLEYVEPSEGGVCRLTSVPFCVCLCVCVYVCVCVTGGQASLLRTMFSIVSLTVPV